MGWGGPRKGTKSGKEGYVITARESDTAPYSIPKAEIPSPPFPLLFYVDDAIEEQCINSREGTKSSRGCESIFEQPLGLGVHN